MGTGRQSRTGVSVAEHAPAATMCPQGSYKLSRRERRELARRLRKAFEAEIRSSRPGHSPRALRRQLGVVAATLAALVASSADPATAEAAVTADVNSVTKKLTVKSSTGDVIVVTCDDGDVKVNGLSPTIDGVPSSATPCAALASVSVDGGTGSDDVNLTGVTPTAAFGSALAIEIVGNAGDDTLRGSGALVDTLTGGTGNDSLVGGLQPSGQYDVVREEGDDGTVAITNTQLLGSPTGLGTDTMSGIEGVAVGTGTATGDNFLNASGFGAGRVTLTGGGGDDTLSGGTVSADTTQTGSGNDSLVGGDGTDRLVQTFNDTGVTLGAGTMTGATGAGALGADTVTGFETAVLTGQGNNNTINASGFGGVVSLEGAGGNDALTGAASADSLSGGAGNDSLTGNAGADTFVGGAGGDTFTAGGTDADLLLESGDDASVTFANTGVTAGGALGTDAISGTLEKISYEGGAEPNDIDASGFTNGPVTLKGLGGSDTLAGATHALAGDLLDGGGATDRLEHSGIADATVTVSNNQLQGPALGTDTLTSLEEVSLGGGTSANAFNASAFTAGPATLSGGDGADSLTGPTSNAATLSGGVGNDTVTGSGGSDLLAESADDPSIALTNVSLSGATTPTGLGTDSLSGIDRASLTGGPAGNVLDASAFTAGPVTLSGGDENDTLSGATQGPSGSDSLDGGTGVLDVLTHTGVPDDSVTLTNTALAGDLTAGGLGGDSVSAIERVTLTGDAGGSVLDASGYTAGNVSLGGGSGTDTVRGGGGLDTIDGGDGNDIVSGGANPVPDSVGGGADDDTLEETVEANGSVTLTGSPPNAALSGALGADALTGIENVSLTGGSGGNALNASGFTGKTTLVGLDGADELTGGTVADSLVGGNGNDLVAGGDGPDTASGGSDNDTMSGGAGTNRVVEAGNDASISFTGDSLTGSTASGGLGTDTVNGFSEADISGGAGANAITVTSAFTGKATLSGAGGQDSLTAGGGQTTLAGGTENDTITGGGAADSLNGGAGVDTLTGGTGNVADTLVGGTETDRIVASADTSFTLDNGQLVSPTLGSDAIGDVEQVSLTGGAGANVLDASGYTVGTVTLDGAGGSDTLTGSPSNDLLLGGAGTVADVVSGGSGTDTAGAALGATDAMTLQGSQANATMSGGLGTDTLTGVEQATVAGGSGANSMDATGFTGPVSLSGDAGADTIKGGSGSDTVQGDTEADVLSGGPGSANDTIGGGAATDALSETLGANDSVTLAGAVAAATLSGGLGTDQIADVEQHTLTGGSGANTIDGHLFSGGTLTVNGQGGNDSIVGTGVADTLAGAGDNDTLTGGGGGDSLDGGTGTADELRESFTGNATLNDSLFSGNGADTLASSSFETASLTGSAGADTLTAAGFSGGSVRVDGQGQKDSLLGTAAADSIVGGGDDDTIRGAGGADTLDGGTGTGDQLRESFSGSAVLSDSAFSGDGADVLASSSFESASLTGSAGADTLTATNFTSGPIVADAGAEADSLVGTGAGDTLSGGTGTAADTLTGALGDDSLSGGAGGDLLVEQADADLTLVDGELTGKGTDTLDAIEAASLTGGTGSNSIDASLFAGQTTLAGAAGADTLTGGDAVDSLDGGAGPDSLDGGLGTDVFDGGADEDSLFTQDGIAESGIACGTESDTATVDADDTPADDCETVSRPPVVPADGDDDGLIDAEDCAPADGTRPAQNGVDADCDGLVDSSGSSGTPAPTPAPTPPDTPPESPPQDTTPPRISVSIPSRVTATAAGVVTTVVTCPASEPQGCRGTVTLRSAAPVVLSRRTILRLGSASFGLRGGQRRAVRIRLNRRHRAVLARVRRMRARLTVVARDAAGNRTTRTRTVTLVAARRRTPR